MRTSNALLAAMLLTACATATPNFTGSEREESCEDCVLLIENALGVDVAVSYYQGAGSLRYLGDVEGLGRRAFRVPRPIWKSSLTIVAESGQRELCRGATEIPASGPAHFRVGDPIDCRTRPRVGGGPEGTEDR